VCRRGCEGQRVPILVGPFEQERKHGVTHSGEDACGNMVVCPGHDRDEVQHTKDSLPVVPVHLIEQGKWEASGEGSCVDSGCERDEAGELFPKSGVEALR